MERVLFIINFPAEIWKNIKYEFKETFQKFGANLLNSLHFMNFFEKILGFS